MCRGHSCLWLREHQVSCPHEVTLRRERDKERDWVKGMLLKTYNCVDIETFETCLCSSKVSVGIFKSCVILENHQSLIINSAFQKFPCCHRKYDCFYNRNPSYAVNIINTWKWPQETRQWFHLILSKQVQMYWISSRNVFPVSQW